MKSISVFLNSKELTSSPREEGIIRVYTHDSGTNNWLVTTEFEFSPGKATSLIELRSMIANMLQRIGDCRIFAARQVAGQLYSILEANRFSIYEAEGAPEQFLDSLLWSEEASKSSSVETMKQPSIPLPEKTDIPGTYFINLKTALNTDPNLSSKKILLPFITSGNFKVLEVICDHIPKWFDSEFKMHGLSSTVNKLDGNEYKVRISTGIL